MKRILETFFGESNLPETTIVSPINRIYMDIGENIENPKDLKGWWKSRIGRIGKREVLLTKAYPGSSIIDVITALTEHSTYIMFLGYCGGLCEEFEIGDIVTAVQSHIEAEDAIYKPRGNIIFPNGVKSTKNITVKSILLEYPTMVDADFDSIDMETGYVYKYSTCQSESIMIVTDLPGKRPFYLVSDSEKKKIAETIPSLTEKALSIMGS